MHCATIITLLRSRNIACSTISKLNPVLKLRWLSSEATKASGTPYSELHIGVIQWTPLLTNDTINLQQLDVSTREMGYAELAWSLGERGLNQINKIERTFSTSNFLPYFLAYFWAAVDTPLHLI